jgi:hypothetical protein
LADRRDKLALLVGQGREHGWSPLGRKFAEVCPALTQVDDQKGVGVKTNAMPRLLLRQRVIVSETAFAEMVVWKLPRRLRGSAHKYKYRLALVVDNTCVMRFDNEAGKGDHKHVGETEVPYVFVSLVQLLADFRREIDRWRLF